MVTLTWIDHSVIVLFFLAVFLIGFYSSRNVSSESANYLLSGRNLGLFLFVLTNVATWYGGILGVGEFTYRYGLVSWFTQGFPYYIFAILFAIFLAPKIRKTSLFTIPDKINESYGKTAGLLSAGFVFLLVSPAPYLLMIGSLLHIITGIDLLPAIILGAVLSSVYLFKGGYKSDVFTDAFEFFVMFAGFILVIAFSFLNFGGFDFLASKLPENHLSLTGGTSPTYIIVWFLIALWTFTDPGFHQRSYAAKTPAVAKYGILISVIFWMLFDFLTTSAGLFARAAVPGIDNAVMAFPALAEKVLPVGIKGVFYAALLATIISTLQSYLFLSATTFSRDVVQKLYHVPDDNLKRYTQLGLLAAIVIGVTIAAVLPSVIDIWYTLGSLVIPGLIFAMISAYFPAFRVSDKYIVLEMSASLILSGGWLAFRTLLDNSSRLNEVEPMIIGLSASFLIHLAGLIKARND